jgi:hypothetical protein
MNYSNNYFIYEDSENMNSYIGGDYPNDVNFNGNPYNMQGKKAGTPNSQKID